MRFVQWWRMHNSLPRDGLIETAYEPIAIPSPQEIRPLRLRELLSMQIPSKGMLLTPILPEKGLVMLYGPRGVGKTYISLSVSYAVATGGALMRWEAPQPRRVLYVDGEMPLVALRDRLDSIVKGSGFPADEQAFQLLAADHLDDGIPSLASPQGQAFIEKFLDGVSLLTLDNVSTLAATARDNDSDSWTPIQEWLLRLRRRGVSVLLNHHAAKGGQQRGTSRREDVLDTVIALRRPTDSQATEGARFEVHFEKTRGMKGDEAKPFEAKLIQDGGGIAWTTRDLADADMERVLALSAEGMSLRDIAEETGIPKSTVQRLKTRGAALAVSVPPSHSLEYGTVGQSRAHCG